MWRGGLRRRFVLPLFCRRSSSSYSERFSVDQSLTSTLETTDGRIFRYAAVFLNGMKSNESAIFAWKHACSLVGATPPTVAIAFFSKRTKAALETIKYFAKEFAQNEDQTTPEDVSADHNSQSTALPPLIGCFMTDQIWWDSTSLLQKGKTVAGDEFIWFAENNGKGNDPKLTGDGNKCTGTGEKKPGKARGHEIKNIKRRKVEVPSSIDCQLMKFLDEKHDKKDEEDTYTDWEDLVSEYEDQKVTNKTFLKNSQESQVPDKDTDFLVKVASSGSKDYKHELTNFCNQFAHKKESRVENSSVRSFGGNQSIDGCAQDENKCNECIENDEEIYKLVLCVGSMEGVKVAGFTTRTTGLPWLPDLATAVTVNNPHMLLLGSPGFQLEELTKRLACMFPKSFRAGAVLHPTVPRENVDAEVFCGEKFLPSGAVGISFSGGGIIPVDAFSEFVCMSIGMMSESSLDPFFDDTVCNYLFLPNGRKVEWLNGHSNGKPQIDIVLDQMYLKLHQDYRNDSFSHDINIQSYIQESDQLSVISVDKVLFPGFFVPLFIDKPCDKLMVKDCMENCKEFGLSSICTDMELDPIECKDIIGTVVKMKVNLFDKLCKSYLIVHGVRRFRVLDRIDIQPGTFGQLSGQVEFIDDLEPKDDKEKSEIRELAKRALSLCYNMFPSAAKVMDMGESFKDPILLSFAIGQILPVSIEVKRRWLRMVNTKDRLKEQMTFLNP